jgi:hypothetical protein
MTSTAEQAAGPSDGSASPGGARRRAADLVRAYPAIATGGGLLILSALLVRWANTRPGFDPYGWLVWGHQTLTLSLNTNAAPSWKPLPYLFTVPYALAGHYEMWLWLITATAISLSGGVFAGRIAYRLTDAPPERQWAAWVAAVVAAAASLGIVDYFHFILSAQSDPIVVALCLGAIDCALSGRRRWAFSLLALAGLARPEVWLFQALYGIWCWRKVPSTRVFMAVWVVVMLALWFGIPAITAKTFFIAGQNALNSPRELHSNKVFGTVGRFLSLYERPVEVAAALALALAVWRRDRRTLILFACVAGWVLLEIAFVLHGWAGVKRYLFPPAALGAVLAGVGIGWLLAHPPRLPRVPSWVGAALAVVLIASFIPGGISAARAEHKDLHQQRKRSQVINELAALVLRLGGPDKFHGCGEPLTRLQYQSMVAFTLHLNVATIGYKYAPAIAATRPIILITPGPVNGWEIQPLRQPLARCRALAGKIDLQI